MSPFPVLLGNAATHIDAELSQILDREAVRGTPPRLVSAMRHAVLGGGKRFRPFLTIQSAALFGVDPSYAQTAACAVELIHCYSLVHDDLPCMDNDELRRGRPTVWKAYDEWTAVLAGDALQSLAFEILSAPTNEDKQPVRAELVHALSCAGGARGMVGGQVLDLEAEKLKSGPLDDIEHITRLQSMKTGRLISVCCELGAILGAASPDERAALRVYGDALGFAFQISDDLLDAEGQSATVGKATGKDAAAGKATLVSLFGVQQARHHLDIAIDQAISALGRFSPSAQPLIEAANYLGRRTY